MKKSMKDKQALFAYRYNQAQETLEDAQKMLKDKLSTRSIINRAYYSTFYMLLALFLHQDIELKTSKHAGIIALFDKQFIHTGKMEKRYSKMLHKLFEARQECDYKELVEFSFEEAQKYVELAKEFLRAVDSFVSK